MCRFGRVLFASGAGSGPFVLCFARRPRRGARGRARAERAQTRRERAASALGRLRARHKHMQASRLELLTRAELTELLVAACGRDATTRLETQRLITARKPTPQWAVDGVLISRDLSMRLLQAMVKDICSTVRDPPSFSVLHSMVRGIAAFSCTCSSWRDCVAESGDTLWKQACEPTLVQTLEKRRWLSLYQSCFRPVLRDALLAHAQLASCRLKPHGMAFIHTPNDAVEWSTKVEEISGYDPSSETGRRFDEFLEALWGPECWRAIESYTWLVELSLDFGEIGMDGGTEGNPRVICEWEGPLTWFKPATGNHLLIPLFDPHNPPAEFADNFDVLNQFGLWGELRLRIFVARGERSACLCDMHISQDVFFATEDSSSFGVALAHDVLLPPRLPVNERRKFAMCPTLGGDEPDALHDPPPPFGTVLLDFVDTQFDFDANHPNVDERNCTIREVLFLLEYRLDLSRMVERGALVEERKLYGDVVAAQAEFPPPDRLVPAISSFMHGATMLGDSSPNY